MTEQTEIEIETTAIPLELLAAESVPTGYEPIERLRGKARSAFAAELWGEILQGWRTTELSAAAVTVTIREVLQLPSDMCRFLWERHKAQKPGNYESRSVGEANKRAGTHLRASDAESALRSALGRPPAILFHVDHDGQRFTVGLLRRSDPGEGEIEELP